MVHNGKKLKWTKNDLKCICVLKCMRAIILIFDLWLMISVPAADYFCIFYLYLTLLLSNYFYLFISTHKLLTYETSKNVGSKSARGS